MPIHFWIWLLFAIVTIWGGFWGYGQRATAGWGWGPPVVVWLLVFAICWAIAGNPVNALVR